MQIHLDVDGGRLSVKIAALSVAAALPLVGCGEDPSGPENGVDTGRVEAFVMDDPGGTSPSVSAVGPALRTSEARSRSAFNGEVQGNFQASISADGQTWIDLGSLNGISVSLQSTGDETSVHGEQRLPLGTYDRVRLIVEAADADLTAGSTIGGLTLQVDASVSIDGGNQVVIEQTVPAFTVTTDAKVRIGFDLNAEAWLTESAVTLGSATRAAVESNVAAAATIVTD